MALDVGLQHAVFDGHSQSGLSISSLLKGRRPAGTRHLTQKIARPARIGLPPHQQPAPDVRAPRRWQPLPRCPRGL